MGLHPMFKDLNHISDRIAVESDICIIGSGAAGLSIALEFIDTRYRVVVLESGSFKFERDTHEVGDVVNVGEPLSDMPTWLRAFGGTLNAWGGGWQVLNEIDFEKRPWVSHSGWPIPYLEVAKYWSVATMRYRLPPLELDDTLYWLPQINTTAGNNLIDQGTRVDVIHCKPLNFADNQRQFRRSKNIEIYLHANVTHLQLSSYYNKIEEVKAQSIRGKSMVCKAKYIILAAAGIENAGLLLNSRDKMNRGIGNQNNLVGRFYMNHPKGPIGHLVPFNKKLDLSHFFGTPTPYGRVFIALSPSTTMMHKYGLLNHNIRFDPVYEYENLPGFQPLRALKHKCIMSDTLSEFTGIKPTIASLLTWDRIKDISLNLAKLAQVSYKKIRNAPRNLKCIEIQSRLEQAPNPVSRVYLSEERNIFGKNKLALDWKIGSAEKESLKTFYHLLKPSWKNVGHLSGGLEETDQWPVSRDAAHHLGTTRMAVTDKEGVVDKDCKVFGVDNLFIAGGSVFPTSGNALPTLTILALSIRLADLLKRRLS